MPVPTDTRARMAESTRSAVAALSRSRGRSRVLGGEDLEIGVGDPRHRGKRHRLAVEPAGLGVEAADLRQIAVAAPEKSTA